jgi:hypothetical protein
MSATTLRSNTQTRRLVAHIADFLVDEGDEATRAWLERTNRGEGFTLSRDTQHGSTVVTEGLHVDDATLDALYRAADGALRAGLIGTPAFWDADLNSL